jgi:hypothetical protein
MSIARTACIVAACCGALVLASACGGKKAKNRGKQGQWIAVDYKFGEETVSAKMSVIDSVSETRPDGSTAVAVYWQIQNTDEKPQQYGWQSKVLLRGKDGKDGKQKPTSGSSTIELPAKAVSKIKHDVYVLPKGTAATDLHWGFVDGDKVQYAIALSPRPAPDCKAVAAADKSLKTKDKNTVLEQICKMKKFPFEVRACLVRTKGNVEACCRQGAGCAKAPE